MVKDMTAGDPAKLLIAFSVPLLLGNLFQQFYNLVDAVIVGHTLGVEAFAAVGAVGAVMFLVFGGVLGLTGGLAVITGQRFGAKDDDGVRRSIAAAMLISAFFTLAITVGCTLATSAILRFMNTPPEIFAASEKYMRIFFYGSIGHVLYNLVAAVLRSLGDSKTPLISLIIGSILNVILDLVFILGFGAGVEGAAWATNISVLVSALWCIAFAYPRYRWLHLKRADWRVDFRDIYRHLALAIPMALQFSITAIGVLVLQTSLNTLGTNAIAAYTAASKLDTFTIMPLFSIGMAMVTYAAQNYGARNYDRILLGVQKCVILALLGCLFGSAVVALGGRTLTAFFIGSEVTEVIELAQIYLYLHAIFYPILGLLFVYRNVLQGIGRTFVPLMAGVGEMIARSIAAAALVPVLGFIGACMSNPLAWLAADIPLIIAYSLVIRGKEFQKGLLNKNYLDDFLHTNYQS